MHKIRLISTSLLTFLLIALSNIHCCIPKISYDQVKVILLHGNGSSTIDGLQVLCKKVHPMNKLTIPLYVGIILQKDDAVFLIQRRNTNWASGCWNFPGGLVKKNESNTQDIIGVYFTAHQWSGVATNNEPEKISNAQWFDRNQLPSNITEHALLAINGLNTQQGYSEHGW